MSLYIEMDYRVVLGHGIDLDELEADVIREQIHEVDSSVDRDAAFDAYFGAQGLNILCNRMPRQDMGIKPTCRERLQNWWKRMNPWS